MAGALMPADAAATPATLMNFLRFMGSLLFLCCRADVSISVAARAVPVVTAEPLALRRQVHRGIFGKEPVGFEREADIFDRHDREILRSTDMRRTTGVPEHNVLVFDGGVPRDVFWQAIAAGMLVGEFTTGVALVRRIARHPDMFCGKAPAPGHEAVRLRQHDGRGMCDQLVAGRRADAVLCIRI